MSRYNIKTMPYKSTFEVASIEFESSGSERLLQIMCKDGTAIRFYHRDDCCESVWLEKPDNLPAVGETITAIIEKGSKSEDTHSDRVEDWYFYTIKTNKGFYDLTFRGSSNGYYSTAVEIACINNDNFYVCPLVVEG